MDHLSDEDLREWRDRRDPSGQAIHSGPVYPLIDELLALRARVGQLEAALKQSVELQSHYAELLNMHDGGQRLTFANVKAWLDRLAALKDAPQ